MAIYHCSVQVASRSTGRSSVGMASYRSGEKIEDKRTGEVYDYTRKHTDGSEILAPENAPDWARDRAELWNQVEQSEKRKDSQVCREVEVSIPQELTDPERRQLIRDFAQNQFVDKGMIADVSFHNMNDENPHAHIMLTTRNIDENGFGQKNRDWNQKALLEQWRDEWGKHANRALEKAGHDIRIDHRSLAAQGIKREPQIHLGPNVSKMETPNISKAGTQEKKPIRTERGDQWTQIDKRNEQLKEPKELTNGRDRSDEASQDSGAVRNRDHAAVSGDRDSARGSSPKREEPEKPNSRHDGKDGSRTAETGKDPQLGRDSSRENGNKLHKPDKEATRSSQEFQPKNVDADSSNKLDVRSSGRAHALDLSEPIPKREERSQPVERDGLNLQPATPSGEKAISATDGLARTQDPTTGTQVNPAQARVEALELPLKAEYMALKAQKKELPTLSDKHCGIDNRLRKIEDEVYKLRHGERSELGNQSKKLGNQEYKLHEAHKAIKDFGKRHPEIGVKSPATRQTLGNMSSGEMKAFSNTLGEAANQLQTLSSKLDKVKSGDLVGEAKDQIMNSAKQAVFKAVPALAAASQLAKTMDLGMDR
jgi:hypothetical protein